MVQATPPLNEASSNGIAVASPSTTVTSAPGRRSRRARARAGSISIERPLAPLHLPMPSDRRLPAVTARLLDDPADQRTLAAWSRSAGARTLARLFVAETGMSFAFSAVVIAIGAFGAGAATAWGRRRRGALAGH